MGSKSKAGSYVQHYKDKKTGEIVAKTKKRGGAFGKK